MTNQINLPWPPRELSPNARVHWAKKAKAAKAYKKEQAYAQPRLFEDSKPAPEQMTL